MKKKRTQYVGVFLSISRMWEMIAGASSSSGKIAMIFFFLVIFFFIFIFSVSLPADKPSSGTQHLAPSHSWSVSTWPTS